MKALGGVHVYLHSQADLPKNLIDLAYLRTSQINGCAYCIDMHSHDLIAQGVPVSKLLLVSAWHEAGDIFDMRERGVLAWTETVTDVARTGAPDDAYADCRRFCILTIVDDCTRESLALVADTSLSGVRVARDLDRLMIERGKPKIIVSNNGSELTSNAILTWADQAGVEWHYIAPGKTYAARLYREL
jgi:AhpD family alkylhydroperoxidase